MLNKAKNETISGPTSLIRFKDRLIQVIKII